MGSSCSSPTIGRRVGDPELTARTSPSLEAARGGSNSKHSCPEHTFISTEYPSPMSVGVQEVQLLATTPDIHIEASLVTGQVSEAADDDADGGGNMNTQALRTDVDQHRMVPAAPQATMDSERSAVTQHAQQYHDILSNPSCHVGLLDADTLAGTSAVDSSVHSVAAESQWSVQQPPRVRHVRRPPRGLLTVLDAAAVANDGGSDFEWNVDESFGAPAPVVNRGPTWNQPFMAQSGRDTALHRTSTTHSLLSMSRAEALESQAVPLPLALASPQRGWSTRVLSELPPMFNLQ